MSERDPRLRPIRDERPPRPEYRPGAAEDFTWNERRQSSVRRPPVIRPLSEAEKRVLRDLGIPVE